jgi:hypothetical protein
MDEAILVHPGSEADMTVLTTQPSYAVVDGSPAPAGRLIVVVTEGDREQLDSSSLIWGWAIETHSNVLLVGLLMHEETESLLRRHLVSLAAAVHDNRVLAEIHIEPWQAWIDGVKAVWRPGDQLACYEGQDGNESSQSLADILRSTFDAPVHLLPATIEMPRGQRSGIGNAVSLSGSIAVLAGFFFLQVRIVEWLHNWAQTALLAGSVVVEFGLVWIWDALTA